VATVKTQPFAQRLKKALSDGLKAAMIDAKIETERVPTTKLHRAMIVAKQFKHLNYSERQDLVWRIIDENFPKEERFHVGTIMTMTPDEMAGKFD